MLVGMNRDERKMQLLESRLGNTSYRISSEANIVSTKLEFNTVLHSISPQKNVTNENAAQAEISANLIKDPLPQTIIGDIDSKKNKQVNEEVKQIIYIDTSSGSNTIASLSNGPKIQDINSIGLKNKPSPPNKRKRTSTSGDDIDNVLDSSPVNNGIVYRLK